MLLLKLLHHPNIVNFLGLVHSSTEYKVAMECIEFDVAALVDTEPGVTLFNSLYQLLHWCRQYSVQHELVVQGIMTTVASDTMEGLNYLHMNDVAHRDLKPQNVLVQNSAQNIISAKICDFGEARSNSMKTHTLMTTRPRQR